ncbi:hypothetical protein NEOLEDRAFT_1045762, partial [Neolentinus lepideus HHB14362 ss-1]
KAVSGLRRPQASLIMQLRSGHVPLNAYLNRIGATTSQYCDHCPGIPEDVHHFVLQCSKYDQQRFNLRLKLGRTASDLSALLTTEVKSLLTYVHQTRRFATTHGEDL